MAMSRTHWLADLWLGTDPAQRLRLRQASMAMALMGLCVPMLHYAVSVGHGESGALLWAWTLVSLGGMALVYAAIRSGWSLRGAVFPMLTLILMFGMFQLRARSAYALSLFALALFGTAMAGMARLRADAYPPEVEIGHFLMLACMLPAVAMLTARLSRIRRRLAEQREELARALGQLQAIATRDELTGLPNRRQVQALMDQELLRALRHHHDFCIALLDLDHFKRINDQHGHAAGDAMLRAFAQAGQAAMRATDVVARWGGEEFVVLLPDTAMPPALGGMERLRQQIASMSVGVAGESLSVTVSIGLTGPLRNETLAQTLERADRLLYQAKATGRNRTVID